MDYYETELRNKNRGYMKLIVWQKAIQLFELGTVDECLVEHERFAGQTVELWRADPAIAIRADHPGM